MAQVTSASMALGLAAWCLRLLVLCSTLLFAFYVVSQTTTVWLFSEAYAAVSAHTPFPFLAQAMSYSSAFINESRGFTSAVWFIWGLTLTAAVASIALKSVCAIIAKADQASEPSTWASAVRRVVHYQLPPRAFWFWLCDGLKVYDAIVVAAWLAINVLFVEQRSSLVENYYRHPKMYQGMMRHHHHGRMERHGFGRPAGQQILGAVSGALGWAATLDILLLFYPVPRSNFLHYLLGTGFSSLIKYHRWLGHGTMILLTLHGWGFWALWLWEGEYIRGFYWDSYGTNMLAGAISWLGGAALWVTATSYVRRNHFEVFYRVHILGFLIFVIFGWMHHTSMWAYSMPGLLLYLLDVTFRLAQQSFPVRLHLGSVDASGQLGQIHLRMDPAYPMRPLQELYMSIWRLSPLQWHPFTAIPARQPRTLLSIIKRYGLWTSHLMNRLQGGGDVMVRVDGPYGDEEDVPDYIKYPTLAMFAGGIGITPVLGVIQDLNARKARLAKGDSLWPARAHLFFTTRGAAELGILQDSIVTEAREAGWLEVHLYSTSKAALAALPDKAAPGPAKAVAPLEVELVSSSASESSDLEPAYVRDIVPPYSFGNAHWAAAHVLCFAGAILGGVGAWAYAAAAAGGSEEGAHDWLVGLALIVFSSVGAMLLPALIIVPAHLWRVAQLRRQSRAVGPADRAPQPPPPSLLSDEEKAPQLLSVTAGRPNIPALLAGVAQHGSEEREIGVIAAGPDTLVNTVRRACAEHNDRVGLAGKPFLHALKYTHTL